MVNGIKAQLHFKGFRIKILNKNVVEIDIDSLPQMVLSVNFGIISFKVTELKSPASKFSTNFLLSSLKEIQIKQIYFY